MFFCDLCGATDAILCKCSFYTPPTYQELERLIYKLYMDDRGSNNLTDAEKKIIDRLVKKGSDHDNYVRGILNRANNNGVEIDDSKGKESE